MDKFGQTTNTSGGDCGNYTTASSECQACSKCFAELPSGSRFCPMCGAPVSVRTQKPKARGNGTGSVYRVGKTWAASVTAGYKIELVDGVPKSTAIRRKKQGFKTKKEALAYISVLQSEKVQRKTPTLNDLWVAYQQGAYTKLSASKQESYRIAWRRIECLGTAKISDLTTPVLQECVNKGGKTHYPARDMKDLLSKLYQIAMANQFVTSNLARFLILPDQESREREAFNDNEVRLLWNDYAAGNLWTGYVLLMIYTGMMPGELLGVRKENIDWARKEIVKSGKKTKVRKETPIVLADVIVPVLADLCANSKSDKLLEANKDSFYKSYYEVLERAGTRKLVPYSCRHSTATALALANIAPSVIQQIMRHAKITTTQQYIHIDMAACLDAINRMAEKQA